MKSKSATAWNAKQFHRLCYAVLEGAPYKAGGETLESIMKRVQDYLDASYLLEINPLRNLRQMLPQYIWEYHELKDRTALLEIISLSDFIWMLDWERSLEFPVLLVTARRQVRIVAPLKYFWIGKGEENRDRLAKGWMAKPVYE
ncbi:MAG: hypothetical protein WCW14_02950 [Candidatus Paceibacterota bacterium]|jgi:hypothetical protein